MAVKRRITFASWADGSRRRSFDRTAAADAVAAVPETELVVAHGNEALTAVNLLERGTAGDLAAPTRFELLALRSFDDRPLDWGPGEVATPVQIAQEKYTAWVTHVSLYENNIAAYDSYGDAPGLGRLAAFIARVSDERVIFRQLYEQDLLRRLEELAGLRRVEFTVHTGHHQAGEPTGDGLIASAIRSARRHRVPSLSLSFGMGRAQPGVATLDDEVADEALALVDNAEELFERLLIVGLSQQPNPQTGRRRTIRSTCSLSASATT